MLDVSSVPREGMMYDVVFPYALRAKNVLAVSLAFTADPPAKGGRHNSND